VTDLKLFNLDGQAALPAIGRVYKDDAECIVLQDGSWTSKQRPDLAEFLTEMKYADDLDSASGTKTIRHVLQRVSDLWPGSQWECYIPKATQNVIY